MLSNDINQGRPHAKGVPKSDQWDDDIEMPKIPKGWRETVYHKKQVMVGDNGPGVYHQIQDEVFLSQQCLVDDKGDYINPNPHDGRIENGRFCFHFPATWYYSHAVNKAIGLRRITLHPRWYNFYVCLRAIKGTNTTYINADFTFHPGMNIGEVVSTMNTVFERSCTSQWITRSDGLRVTCSYNNQTNRFSIEFKPYSSALHQITEWRIELSQTTDSDFFELMNVLPSDRKKYVSSGTAPTTSYPLMTFDNVWNRKPEQLYFHASFVNHTQFNYLGRADDFYPKPSKIFTADNLPMEFYVWLTKDVMHPITLPYERFIIELAFIIDSTDYQSP
jgi:hypothetical protein